MSKTAKSPFSLTLSVFIGLAVLSYKFSLSLTTGHYSHAICAHHRTHTHICKHVSEISYDIARITATDAICVVSTVYAMLRWYFPLCFLSICIDNYTSIHNVRSVKHLCAQYTQYESHSKAHTWRYYSLDYTQTLEKPAYTLTLSDGTETTAEARLDAAIIFVSFAFT